MFIDTWAFTISCEKVFGGKGVANSVEFEDAGDVGCEISRLDQTIKLIGQCADAVRHNGLHTGLNCGSAGEVAGRHVREGDAR